MTVQEVYNYLDENYIEIYERIGNEAWISKYLKKFLDDGCKAQMNKAILDKSWEDAFKAVHSIKGLALNLGLQKLSKVASTLCEELRDGTPKSGETEISQMALAVNAEYDRVVEVLKQLD